MSRATLLKRVLEPVRASWSTLSGPSRIVITRNTVLTTSSGLLVGFQCCPDWISYSQSLPIITTAAISATIGYHLTLMLGDLPETRIFAAIKRVQFQEIQVLKLVRKGCSESEIGFCMICLNDKQIIQNPAMSEYRDERDRLIRLGQVYNDQVHYDHRVRLVMDD